MNEAKSNPELIYCLSVFCGWKGVESLVDAHTVKSRAHNYHPVQMPDSVELPKTDFYKHAKLSRLKYAVPKSDILKLQTLYEKNVGCVNRMIWFLETQEAEALQLVHDDINKAIRERMYMVSGLLKAWKRHNQNENQG
jgi:hypothetical protein